MSYSLQLLNIFLAELTLLLNLLAFFLNEASIHIISRSIRVCRLSFLVHFEDSLDSLDMLLPLLVMLEHILIRISLIACNTMKLRGGSFFLFFSSLDPFDPLDDVFPPEETLLIPFLLKHLFSLLLNLLPVHKWLSPFEEVFQVSAQALQIVFVLLGGGMLLDIERDQVELIEVLQPCEVVIALDHIGLLQLLDVSVLHIQSMQVHILSVSLLSCEHPLAIVDHLLHHLVK
jgi:hypothetical protein